MIIIMYIAIIVCKISLSSCDGRIVGNNDTQTTYQLFSQGSLGKHMINCSVYPKFNNLSVFKLDYCMHQKRQSKDLKDFIRICKPSVEKRQKMLSTRLTKHMKNVCSQNGSFRHEYLEHLTCFNSVNTDCIIQIQHDIKVAKEKRLTKLRKDMKTNYTYTKALNKKQLCKSVYYCLLSVQTIINATCGQGAEQLARQIFNMTVFSQLKGKCDNNIIVNYIDSRSLKLSVFIHNWLETFILQLTVFTLLCYLLVPIIAKWLLKLMEHMYGINSVSINSMEACLEESQV